MYIKYSLNLFSVSTRCYRATIQMDPIQQPWNMYILPVVCYSGGFSVVLQRPQERCVTTLKTPV